MLLYILAYLGGILTILSPCILPVLPFVLARSDRPFISNGLPMLGGMALAFTAIASLAAVGGEWAVSANSGARIFALVLMAGFALLLLFPSLSERVMRPLVGWGERLSNRADKGSGLDTIAQAFGGVNVLDVPTAAVVPEVLVGGGIDAEHERLEIVGPFAVDFVDSVLHGNYEKKEDAVVGTSPGWLNGWSYGDGTVRPDRKIHNGLKMLNLRNTRHRSRRSDARRLPRRKN